MILKILLKVKIIEYCMDTLLNTATKNIKDPDGFYIGKKFKKLISPDGKSYNNCVIMNIIKKKGMVSSVFDDDVIFSFKSDDGVNLGTNSFKTF